MDTMSDKLLNFVKYILGENPDNIVYVNENTLPEVLEFIEKNHSKMKSLETMEDLLDFTFCDTWRKIRESVLSHRFSTDMNNRFNDMMSKLKPEDIKTEIINNPKGVDITPVNITPEIMNDSNLNETNDINMNDETKNNIEESEMLESKEFHDSEADRRTAALKNAKIKIALPMTKEYFLEKMKEIEKTQKSMYEDKELKELEQLKTILEESYKKGIGTHESGGGDKYEMVNHPTHYNSSSVETIEKMVRIWGKEQTAMWCEMTAFKYRERIGLKPDNSLEQEMGKIRWYENKARELRS